MKIKLLFLFYIITQLTNAQINENFDGIVTGWNFSGASVASGQACSLAQSVLYTSIGNFAITPSITNPDKLNFNIKRSTTATPVMSIDVQISNASPVSQTSGPWTTVTTIGSTVLATCSAITPIDLSIYSGLRYVKFLDSRASGAQQRSIDDVTISQVVAGSVPVVTGATRTGTVGTAFNYNVIATNSPTSYALASGTLPSGLNLNVTTGLISGTPTINGNFTANITATNGSGTSSAAAINFTINAAASVCVTQGFGSGTTVPSGWIFTGISGTYTVASNYGLASPSLSFDTTNDLIITEILPTGNAASQLSFWIKGQGINSGSTSTFVIDGFDGTSWTNIDIINSSALIASSGSAVIKTYNSGSIPALGPGFLRFRFTYKKGVGNLAFDDVSISCVSASQNIPTVIGTSEIATVGGAFSAFVNATNFPTSFAIVNGTLPTGLNFNLTTGQISGAPLLSGAYSIDVTATNGAGTSAIGTIVITVSAYVPGCYLVDFTDGAAKSAFASDNIVLNGKLWNLSETLTGGTNTISDYGTNNLCLRLRSNANAAATLIQDKSYGIGAISFNYKKYLTGTYTNQTFGVEYSKDGGNSWINIGFVSPSTTTSQTFNRTINQSGPIRFRILFASGTEDNSVRLNVDDLMICDFVSDPKEIEVYGNATTINNNSIIVSENNSTNFSPAFFVGVDVPIVKTFTIFNFGTGVLNLSSLSISSSANFTITSGLSSTVLTNGQSATFSITFNAINVGLKTATVTILNDDANEGTYNFLISAKVLNYSKCTLLAPTIIAQQDFDSNVAYTYTANINNANTTLGGGTGFGANRTTPVNMFIGSNSFQSKSNLNTIIFASQNTQNYQNIELSLNIGGFGTTATFGMNTADYIQVSISIDGGIKFYPQLRISGNNNSIFDLNNTLPTNIAKYKTNATVATIFGCTNNSTNTVSGNYKINNLPNVPDLRIQIAFLSSSASKIWAVDNISLKGQLPLTSAWDGTNWLPTVPNTSTKAIIGANYTTDLINGSIDSCECQINTGKTVNIESNYYLDCESNFINNGILNVKNSGSFIQLNDDAVNSSTANNIMRTTSQFEKFDYISWASPVIGTTLTNSFNSWNNTRAYTFNTPTFSDIYSGLGYPQTAAGSDNYDDNGDEWLNVGLNTPFVAAKGYLLMPAITGIFPRTEDVTFSGVLNNGLKTYTLELSQNTANNNDDYNLVGNPFASAISADDFIRANITPIAKANNITGTLSFWTHKGDIQPYTTNPGPYFNNYSANDYAMYNLSGPVGVGSPSVSGSVPPSGFIASGQGFYVEAETTNDLVFNNSMRNKSFNNSQFFRQSRSTNSENVIPEKDRIWLNLSNTDNMFCQQLIAYIPGTSLDFDYGYDGRYNPANSYLGFYSTIDSDLTSMFKIQSRSDFNENDAVVIGYSSIVSGATSISIDHTEGILNDPTTNVFLQDNLLNITHDLKAAPYNFITNYGTYNDRFILKYINASLSNNSFDIENNVKIDARNNKININSTLENIKSIEVFDLIGRKVYNELNINKKTLVVQNINAVNQVLIVKTYLENGSVVTKKVIVY